MKLCFISSSMGRGRIRSRELGALMNTRGSGGASAAGAARYYGAPGKRRNIPGSRRPKQAARKNLSHYDSITYVEGSGSVAGSGGGSRLGSAGRATCAFWPAIGGRDR